VIAQLITRKMKRKSNSILFDVDMNAVMPTAKSLAWCQVIALSEYVNNVINI
jgi:hypothetical protein